MTILYYVLCLSILYAPFGNKYLKSCVLFALCLAVCLVRDPYAADDASNYIGYYSDYIDDLGAEPGFLLFSQLPKLFQLGPIASYNLVSLFLLSSIFLYSIRAKTSLPLVFFAVTEYYPLLSFNAHRQGLAISFFVCLLTALLPYLKKQFKLDSRSIATLFSLLILFLSTHNSSFVFVAILALIFVLTAILPNIAGNLLTPKFNYKSIILGMLILAFAYLVLSTRLDALAGAASVYYNRNDAYGSGIYGSLYRITIAIIITLIADINLLRIKYFMYCVQSPTISQSSLISYGLGFLLLSFLTPLVSLQLFIRLSYFSLLPIIFSLYIISCKPPNSNAIAKLVISFAAIVSITSSAVTRILGL